MTSFYDRTNVLAAARTTALDTRDKALAKAMLATQAAHATYHSDIGALEADFARTSAEIERGIAEDTGEALDAALAQMTQSSRAAVSAFATAARAAIARCQIETGDSLSWVVIALAYGRLYKVADRIVHPDARSFALASNVAACATSVLKDLTSGAPDVALGDSMNKLELAIGRLGSSFPSAPEHHRIAASLASDQAMYKALAAADSAGVL